MLILMAVAFLANTVCVAMERTECQTKNQSNTLQTYCLATSHQNTKLNGILIHIATCQ